MKINALRQMSHIRQKNVELIGGNCEMSPIFVLSIKSKEMKLYHIALENLGSEIMLRPTVSNEAHSSEVDFARVCASPSIEACVDGLAMCEKLRTGCKSARLCGFVYEIENSHEFVAYTDVFDFNITQEHISSKAAAAKLVGIIHFPASANASYLNIEKTFRSQKGVVFEVIDETIFNQYYA